MVGNYIDLSMQTLEVSLEYYENPPGRDLTYVRKLISCRVRGYQIKLTMC